MLVGPGRACFLFLLGLLVAGCPSRRPATISTPSPSAPPYKKVTFELARDGLPRGQIWKSQVVLGDVNGDGFDDLGAVSRLADGPWVYITDGKGNWRPGSDGLPRQTFCGGGMDFADLNNDGKTDVAIADHCNGVYAFFGDGTGKWTNASSGLPTVGSEDVTIADFNHDGCNDLAIVTAQEEGVRAYLGDCNGKWTESSTGLPLEEWGNGIVAADMNNDGHVDLVAAYSAGPRVFLGNGQGAWRDASGGLPAPDIHGLYWGIAVGDVNNDGRLDIASGAAIPGAEVFVQKEDGTYENVSGTELLVPDVGQEKAKAQVVRWFRQDLEYVSGGDPLVELDMGGKKVELVADHPGTLRILKPAGATVAVGESIGKVGILPMNALGVALGDVNEDGNVDLVAVGKTALDEIGGVYGVFVMLGDGQGHWRYAPDTGLPFTGKERTWGVDLGDVNGDGHLDVAVAFGDVLSPTWRSGSLKGKGMNDPELKKATPERGKFGSLEVWVGRPGS
ncbi:MAG: hypothetical protein KatS3mg076_2243 [Candidatus Binatia bacterium]|nr:MAG: hypothetical protein KatS3mg076_2243 [Candidatus Binatia bacterium]